MKHGLFVITILLSGLVHAMPRAGGQQNTLTFKDWFVVSNTLKPKMSSPVKKIGSHQGEQGAELKLKLHRQGLAHLSSAELAKALLLTREAEK